MVKLLCDKCGTDCDLVGFDMEQFGFTVWGDMDINDLYTPKPEKEEKKKTIICPHCGEAIEI